MRFPCTLSSKKSPCKKLLKNIRLVLCSQYEQPSQTVTTNKEVNMNESEYPPFSGLNRLFRTFDDIHPSRPFNTVLDSRAWVLDIDIAEDESGLTFWADVPGVDTDDLEITVEQNKLSISGERVVDPASGEGTYKRGERTSGHFLRQFTLPESADTSNISAKADKGVLRISIPKAVNSDKLNIQVEDLD
jgi:HSP20 family protein